MKDPRDMSYDELRAFVYQTDAAEVVQYADEIKDKLASVCWDIGQMWDAVEGVDPQKGSVQRYGATPNKRSMTYKLRKVAGYTYP